MDYAKELILAVKRNNIHGGYGLQNECEALVGHVMNNMANGNLPTLDADVKNDEGATKFREQGNQNFVMGEDDDALEKYTMSLAYAKSKESMALAFANRSAVLYRKQLYRECLIDIDAALTYGYPDDKKKKLRERAEKSIEALRQLYKLKDLNMNDLPVKDEATTSIQSDKDSALKNKDKCSLIKEFIENKNSKIEGITKEDMVELMSNTSSTIPRYVLAEQELNLAHGPNDEVPAFSKGMQITYSKKYGRHVVATEDFMPGDILAIETPFAYIVYKEKFYTYCHHCLQQSYNLIPCPNCPIGQYCSENCKSLSWKMAHQLECPIYSVLSKLLNVDMDKIKILTKILRMLIVVTKNGTAIDELRKDEQIAEKNPDSRTAGFTDQGIFDSTSPRSALSLATNLDTRPFHDISAFACISALTAILLATETTFFGKKYNPNQLKNIAEEDDVRFCATIVFRNCVIVSSNSFSVQPEPGVKTGSGIYVAASLMNHSCAPNTFRHFDGLKMITRALEPIKAGDQIFACYGGGYHYMGREERKRKMMQEYFFDCDCKACINDWPTYSEIVRNHLGAINKKDKKLQEKLKPFRQRLLVNKYDIDAVKNVLNILYAEAKMPCEEIVYAIQYLKNYYIDP